MSKSGAVSEQSAAAIRSAEEKELREREKERMDRERKLAEERSQNALKIQRKQRLQALVQKRKSNMAYLKKVHQGGSYWLNISLLVRDDIANYASKGSAPNSRTESYFSLALSISRILNLNGGLAVLRAFSQLVEEWEYHWTAGGTMQSVKFMMAKQSACIYPRSVPGEGYTELVRPSIYKFQNKISNKIVYEHLQLPHLPFPLDYVEVFLALCDELYKLYDKLMHEECYSVQVVYDTIVRLDARIKHHVINLAAKEITDVALQKVRQGIVGVRLLNGMAVRHHQHHQQHQHQQQSQMPSSSSSSASGRTSPVLTTSAGTQGPLSALSSHPSSPARLGQPARTPPPQPPVNVFAASIGGPIEHGGCSSSSSSSSGSKTTSSGAGAGGGGGIAMIAALDADCACSSSSSSSNSSAIVLENVPSGISSPISSFILPKTIPPDVAAADAEETSET